MKLYPLQLSAICWVLFLFNASASVFYVDVNSTNPTPPYADWSTAATDIQSAIDASSDGDLILVTNGIYQTGGRVVYGSLTNRVAINKAVTVQSVNGPSATMIEGSIPDIALSRVAYLTNGAVLIGFTLTNGVAYSGDLVKERCGGGIWCESSNAIILNCVIIGNTASWDGGGAYFGTLSNCTFIGNSAYYGGGGFSNLLNNCTFIGNSVYQAGGGAYGSKLNNCILTNNSADYYGGGTYNSVLTNCILSGNHAEMGGGATGGSLTTCKLFANRSADYGGGAYGATLNNCLLYSNTLTSSGIGGGAIYSVLINCTIVKNTAGNARGVYGCNLKNSIVYYNNNSADADSSCTFTNCCIPNLYSGYGNFNYAPLFKNFNGNDFHLQSNSPCINAGNNLYVILTNDFDGNTRIIGGTVDVGAYEFQSPTSILSYAWAQQYGLSINGSADYADSDGDGVNNWQEWRAGTNPKNASSFLKLLSPAVTITNATVTWQSVSGVIYYLQRSGDLTIQSSFSMIQSNIVGQAGTTSYTDTNAIGSGPFFYRVGVQ